MMYGNLTSSWDITEHLFYIVIFAVSFKACNYSMITGTVYNEIIATILVTVLFLLQSVTEFAMHKTLQSLVCTTSCNNSS